MKVRYCLCMLAAFALLADEPATTGDAANSNKEIVSAEANVSVPADKSAGTVEPVEPTKAVSSAIPDACSADIAKDKRGDIIFLMVLAGVAALFSLLASLFVMVFSNVLGKRLEQLKSDISFLAAKKTEAVPLLPQIDEKTVASCVRSAVNDALVKLNAKQESAVPSKNEALDAICERLGVGAARVKMDELLEKWTAASKQFGELEKKLAALKDDTDDLEGRFSRSVQAQLNPLLESANGVQTALSSATDAVKAYKADSDTLSEVALQGRDIVAWMRNESAVISRIETESARIEASLDKLTETSASLSALSANMLSSKDANEKAQQAVMERERLSGENETLANERKILFEAKQNLETQVSSLKADSALQNEKIAAGDALVASLKNDCAALKAGQAKAAADLARTMAELVDCRRALEKSGSELLEVQAKANAAAEEAERFKQSHEKLLHIQPDYEKLRAEALGMYPAKVREPQYAGHLQLLCSSAENGMLEAELCARNLSTVNALLKQKGELPKENQEQLMRNLWYFSKNLTAFCRNSGWESQKTYDELNVWLSFFIEEDDKRFSLSLPGLGEGVTTSWMSPNVPGVSVVSAVETWAVFAPGSASPAHKAFVR